MEKKELITKLKQFLEEESRSCSMDPACVTAEYVCRMWGGTVPLEDIEEVLKEVKEKYRDK